MRREIEKILQTHAVEGTFHTHVSMLQPKGRFQFNRQTLEDFWKKYSESLEEDDDDNLFGIAEKPHHNYIPVLVDVDIKIKEVDGIEIGDEHLYSEEQVEKTIKIYQSVLRNIVEDCQDEDLTCVLLEKPIYRISKDDVTFAKNGFHLHFPYLFLNKVDQQVQLIPRVQEEMNKMKVFEDLGFENSGDLIDKAVCTVPWLLYGSRKSENMDPYKVTKVFDHECQEIDIEEAFKYYRLFDMREELISIKGKVKQFLPRILSIIPYGRETKELKHGLISPLKEKMKEKKQSTQKMKVSVAEALKISEKLLPMLADWRSEDRNEWMTIGWILFNIGEGCPEALDQWMDFSARCGEKFDESNCIYEWERMVTKELTLGTLRYYASVDNPEAYKEFKKEQAEHYVKEALNGSHNDIAKVLYAEYGNEFVCASIVTRTWYQFDKHKWEPIEEGVFLREKISDEIVDRFVKMGQEMMAALGAVDDVGDKASHNARIKQIQKIINNLKSAPYKANIMKEAMEVFYDRRFREKLDTNPYLIAFKNGVYDLKLNVFRPGRPEDFISKSLPIDYVEYDQGDEMVQEVYNYLEKVFPDKSVRTYFMDQSSDVFVGGNSQKVVIFWTGEGDNAKSVTQGLFEKMLGPLAIKFNTTVVTGKKPASGSAYADLARAGGGVRWAVLEEPDGDEMVNVGVLKHLSGNDSFYARDLFERGKDGREITPMFKLIFICLAGDTSISLPSGMSLSIEKMSGNKTVLSWDEKIDRIVPTQQHKFLKKGRQKCLTIVLADGRKITCTPEHKFLTAQNEWVEAKNIVKDFTTLKMSVNNPLCDDIFDNHDYKLVIGDLSFDLSQQDKCFEAAAISRLLGYVMTDGSYNKQLYIGHSIDAQGVLDDIKLLCGKEPSIGKVNSVMKINIPECICQNFDKLLGKQTGKKVYSDMVLPKFVYDEKCPSFVLREFYAGMFGGDGVLPSYVKKQCTMMQLVGSKSKEFLPSIVKCFQTICDSLRERFGIEAKVTKPVLYKNFETDISGIDKYNVFIRIAKNDSILAFAEKVGVRYCCHKSYRLTAVSSLLRYKRIVSVQNQSIIEKTREFIIEGDNVKEAYNKAVEWVYQTQGLSDPDNVITYGKIKYYYIHYGNDIKLWSVDCDTYVNTTGLSNFFNNGKDKHNYSVNISETALPCYNMHVIHIEDAGEKDVFDLNIDEPYSNFLANGVVTHNCNKLPKMKYSDKATWNRIRVIPFEATFVRSGEPCPDSHAEQMRQKRFPMDPNFAAKIPKMVQAFAWVLLEHRKRITTRIEPEKVKAATALYRKQNDIYRQFVEESIVEDAGKSINLTELYAHFKEWFKEGFPHHQIPVKNEVKEYFTKVWDEPEKGMKWSGYRARTLKDDLDTGEAVELGEDDLADYGDDGDAMPPV